MSQRDVKRKVIYDTLNNKIIEDLINIVYQYYDFYSVAYNITNHYFIYDLEYNDLSNGEQYVPQFSLGTKLLNRLTDESCDKLEDMVDTVAQLNKYATLEFSDWKLIKIAMVRRTFGYKISGKQFLSFYPSVILNYSQGLISRSDEYVNIYRSFDFPSENYDDKFFKILYNYGRGLGLNFT
jgi:hypothetical protein